MVPVILSGGSGSRLWPLSRAMRPKQFLSITESRSLFQLTLQRLEGIPDIQPPIVVCNHEHRFLVAEQCRSGSTNPSAILLEPLGRNTAPAIAVAALQASHSGEDPLLLVLPSDHVVDNVEEFRRSIEQAAKAAEQGFLLTFGITPDRPETGYGYMKAGKPTAVDGVTSVAKFVEKPDSKTAEAYLAASDYFWNSGMFLFRASAYLEELGRYCPNMLACCVTASEKARSDLDFIRLDEASFAECPSNSVDYAVMEKTDKAAMIALDAGWNDVGAWPAVWATQEKDARGNAKRGDVLFESTDNCYVHADHRLVTLLGTHDLIVIETADAVLVGHKNYAQDVKQIVETLKASNRPETDVHREVFRPWGSFDNIDRGNKYQVKQITVKPSGKLSLQYHRHRAEHWIVVSGTAKVTIGTSTKIVAENQSVFIPVGETHCLENPGTIPLELIEVQTGNYLGEDDIVRLEDVYGRTSEKNP